MSNDGCLRAVSNLVAFLSLAKKRTKCVLVFTTLLCAAVSSVAQLQTASQWDSQPTPPDRLASAKPAPGTTSVTVPAGTSIALVLTHPIQSRYIHRGDDIYAQVISPIASGNEVVIPAGTLVQGKVDRLGRNGGRGELRLQSMSISYPDGYVAPVSGPITLESDEGYAIKDPGNGHIGAALALPAGGAGVGALIGHFTASSQPNTITSTLPPGCTGQPPECLTSSVTAPGSTAKNTIIGAMVGGAVGGVAAFALLLHTRNFFLDVGSPVEMVLEHPLILQGDQVSDAVRDSEQHPVPEQPIAQRPQPLPPYTDPGICYTPGTPGTPGVDIPGTGATANSPGTPGTHIPGIPPTPPTPSVMDIRLSGTVFYWIRLCSGGRGLLRAL
jgi:hypothetical protein